MVKAELDQVLSLDPNTPIIVSVYYDLQIDGEWDETFEAVIDVNTLNIIVTNMLDNDLRFPMYMCNAGGEMEYDEFIDHMSVTRITQAEADVLLKYNAFNTLRVDEFLDRI